jgi:DNA-3-methyladenine glycosylase I
MSTYCEFTKELDASNHHRIYHDTMYGFPILDDNELFGRLILEINQAGLSWNTILVKQENFRKAYSNFSISEIADYDEKKYNELMQNAGIIRNKLKIKAAIFNAQQVLHIQEEFGSFKNWLDDRGNLSLKEWTTLFKKTFKFTGGLIVEEFLLSTGYIKGAHSKNCIIFDKVFASSPKWLEYEKV